MANIYKRLGLQIAEKGTYLKNIGVPFYVVMQHRPFVYLKKRIPFEEVQDKNEWDITFVTFDYTGETLKSGMLEFKQTLTARDQPCQLHCGDVDGSTRR